MDNQATSDSALDELTGKPGNDGAGLAMVDASPKAPVTPNPVLILHRALRGRYLLAITLGLLLGGIGAYVGWRSKSPTYRSQGLIRIAAALPTVMVETDQNRFLGMFDTFMQSQKLLIGSRRVIDMAMQDPVWRSGGKTAPDADAIAKDLVVDIKPRSEYIEVSVTDSDPNLAANAVTTIINTYAELYNNQDRQMERQRTGLLEERKTALEGQLKQLRDEIGAIAEEYGTDKLDAFYTQATERVAKLEQSLNDLRLNIANAEAQEKASGAGTTQPVTTADKMKAQAAATEYQVASDNLMLYFETRQAELEDELDKLAVRGLGDNNVSVIIVRHELEHIRERMTKYGELLRQIRAQPQDVGNRSPENLHVNETNLLKVLSEAKPEMLRLGAKRMRIQRLQTDVDASNAELVLINHRLESLKMEGALGGRLNIMGTGEVPLVPDKDPRQRNTAAGAGVGLVLPTGALFLLGFLRRRYRYADEPETDVAKRAPLLGILPYIGKEADRDSMLAAARCVHQVRVRLTSQPAAKGARIYMITSSAAGEGKTSLTMALGISFASSGFRTLLVDCDLVGRGLTGCFKAQRFGGMRDALAHGDIKPYVIKTIRGLRLLPAGQADLADSYAISTEALKPLLDQARQLYDVILVDTGPMLGSVEASVLAQQVDAVVFAISRGGHRGLVERAMSSLRDVGVPLAGFVFNRAKFYEIGRTSDTSLRSLAIGEASVVDESRATRLRSLAWLGPLAHAVASSCRQPGNERKEPGGAASGGQADSPTAEDASDDEPIQ